MIFLDTNIWIELTSVSNPVDAHSVYQATKATELFLEILRHHETIVTCREQLVEVINTVVKAKKGSYNKVAEPHAGVSLIKEFREKRPIEYAQAIDICRLAIKDICDNAKVDTDFNYAVDDILDCMHLADINDCMYFEYCKDRNIKLYTFDKDFLKLDPEGSIVEIL